VKPLPPANPQKKIQGKSQPFPQSNPNNKIRSAHERRSTRGAESLGLSLIVLPPPASYIRKN
jgi:hypothetical protein